MEAVLIYHVIMLFGSAFVLCLCYIAAQQMPYPQVAWYRTPWSDEASLPGQAAQILSIRSTQLMLIAGWLLLLGIDVADGKVTPFVIVTFITMCCGHFSLVLWVHTLLKAYSRMPRAPSRQLSHAASMGQRSIPVDEAMLVLVLQPDFEGAVALEREDPEWLWTKHKGVSLAYTITQRADKSKDTGDAAKKGGSPCLPPAPSTLTSSVQPATLSHSIHEEGSSSYGNSSHLSDASSNHEDSTCHHSSQHSGSSCAEGGSSCHVKDSCDEGSSSHVAAVSSHAAAVLKVAAAAT